MRKTVVLTFSSSQELEGLERGPTISFADGKDRGPRDSSSSSRAVLLGHGSLCENHVKGVMSTFLV